MTIKERLKEFETKFYYMQFNFSRQLNFLDGIFLLIGDGIAPRDALRLTMNAGDPIDTAVARNMLGRLREGFPLSSSMRDLFRHDVAAAVAAAEQSSDFAGAGLKVVRHLREQLETRQGVVGRLLRPLAYFVLAIGLYSMFSAIIWPRYEDFAPIDTWHPLARTSHIFGLFFVNYWYLVVAGLVLLGLTVRYLMINWTGTLRLYLDQLWPLTLYRGIQAANTLESLGTLLVAGHDFRTALAMATKYASPHTKQYLTKVRYRLRDGRNIPRALDVGLLTDNDISRLRLLAEFKGLRDAMVRMGATSRQILMKRLGAMSALLSAMGLAVVAASYAGLVLSMYLNIANMQTQLTGAGIIP